MASYNGAKCLICEKEFSESDDIVVCPQCGTPYHGECYFEKGECINNALHESGGTWKREEAVNSEEKADSRHEHNKICGECGAINKAHSLICERCGNSLLNNQPKTEAGQEGGFKRNDFPFGSMEAMGINPEDKYCGMNPDEKFEGTPLSDVSEFVGKNRFYYLPMFKRMKDTGKKISLNFICLFFPQFYFANRKMWLFAAFTTAVSFMLSLPTLMYYMVETNMAGGILQNLNTESVAFQAVSNLTYYLNIAYTISMFLFSNWLYYRHVLKKVKHIKSENADNSAEAIRKCGGTSTAGIVITLLVQGVMTLLLMFIFNVY